MPEVDRRIWLGIHDRRQAAVHEAGHIVVGKLLGLGSTTGYIFLNFAPEPGEKLWLGKCHYDARKLLRLSRLKRRMFAVAGAVAETWWGGEVPDPDFWFEPEMMSPSDWAGTGCEPGFPDNSCCKAIRAAADLLSPDGQGWRDLCLTARALLVNSRNIVPHTACKEVPAP